jgi:pimeloyl-ACP methyl ester carboxylesterase
MPRARANGIELEYDIVGEGTPLVLVMGIGAQLVQWPDGLVETLASRGFQVIRFDNRDCGLSTRLEDARVPRIKDTLLRGLLGGTVEAPYSLIDMADDVVGLLDHLALPTAHVLGVSLGGMVAQTMAIVHPSRVRTLTSVMSTTGRRRDSVGRPRAIKALLGPAPRNEEDAVARHLEFRRICGSTGFQRDTALEATIARRSWARGYYPRGFLRQLAAVMATGDRTHALRFVRVPTLVMHGTVDPLIPPRGGRATARAIPNARLRMIDGMGHDLPRGAWPIIADEVSAHARQHDPSFAFGRSSASRPSAPA